MSFNKSVVGGTFDNFHLGQKELLKKAFENSKKVVIGITSDDFAKRFRTEKIESYEVRKKNVEDFCKKLGDYEIVEINDFYGPSTIDPDIDCIVVSEETLLRAQEINAVRFKKGLSKLAILMIPLYMAKDNKPLSSDRIRRGEINSDGDPI
jgi:pantetheine-phosphate adenylyltransferase